MNLDNLSEAYQHWKSVRTRLAHTIQDYVDACNTLDAAFSRHSGQSSFEKTLAYIDAELSGLKQEYERLSRTHAVLARNRNQSKKLAPINNLPAEILSQILRYAIRICAKELRPITAPTAPHYVSPGALAGVCSIWHKTIISLPWLWSHVDLIVGKTNNKNYLYCAAAWSERAKNAPLRAHVLPADDTTDIDESDVLKLLEVFASLAKRVQRLCMVLTPSMESLAKRLLACWIKHGSPGVARSLEWKPVEPNQAGFHTWDSFAVDDISPAQIEHFFHSLQSVDLSGLHIPWESKLYHGLVRLALVSTEGGGYQLTQSELATIFQSSPGLRELRLDGVGVESEEWVTQEPIILQDLQALAVRNSLRVMLPLIAPGSNPLRVGVSVKGDLRRLEAVRSFFNRSTIETLDLANDQMYDCWFPFVLGRLEHLKTLIIADCNFSVPDIEDFLTRSSEEKTVLWPKLNTMHLSRCTLQSDILLKLLSRHSVQTL